MEKVQHNRGQATSQAGNSLAPVGVQSWGTPAEGGAAAAQPHTLPHAHDIISGLGSALEQDAAFNTSLPSVKPGAFGVSHAWIEGLGLGRGGCHTAQGCPRPAQPVLTQPQGLGVGAGTAFLKVLPSLSVVHNPGLLFKEFSTRVLVIYLDSAHPIRLAGDRPPLSLPLTPDLGSFHFQPGRPGPAPDCSSWWWQGGRGCCSSGLCKLPGDPGISLLGSTKPLIFILFSAATLPAGSWEVTGEFEDHETAF